MAWGLGAGKYDGNLHKQADRSGENLPHGGYSGVQALSVRSQVKHHGGYGGKGIENPFQSAPISRGLLVPHMTFGNVWRLGIKTH